MLVAALPAERKILELIEGSLALMGYEVVRVLLRGTEKTRTLQIMIERTDGAAINVDDCADASGQISAVLDVHDPIEQRYRLEVSSPGIDRPLTRPKDFISNIGREVVAEAKTAPDDSGRKKWRGELLSADEQGFVLSFKEGKTESQVKIDYADASRAKLALTEALLKEYETEL